MACKFKGNEIWNIVMLGGKTVQFAQDMLAPQSGAPLLLPPNKAR